MKPNDKIAKWIVATSTLPARSSVKDSRVIWSLEAIASWNSIDHVHFQWPLPTEFSRERNKAEPEKKIPLSLKTFIFDLIVKLKSSSTAFSLTCRSWSKRKEFWNSSKRPNVKNSKTMLAGPQSPNLTEPCRTCLSKLPAILPPTIRPINTKQTNGMTNGTSSPNPN